MPDEASAASVRGAGGCRIIWESGERLALLTYMDEDAEGSPVIWKWWPITMLRAAKVDPNPR